MSVPTSPPVTAPLLLPAHAADIALALQSTWRIRDEVAGSIKLQFEIAEMAQIQMWIELFSHIESPTSVTGFTASSFHSLTSAVGDAWLYAATPDHRFERAAWWLAHQVAPTLDVDLIFPISTEQARAATTLFRTLKNLAFNADNPGVLPVARIAEVMLHRFRLATFSGTQIVVSAALPTLILDALTDIAVAEHELSPTLLPADTRDVLAAWAASTLVTLTLDDPQTSLLLAP